jgi:vancomycin permeability regulator SanA
MQKQKNGRWRRRLLRTLLGVIILFIIACFVFDHYVQFRKSDSELEKIFAENHIPASIHYCTAQGR